MSNLNKALEPTNVKEALDNQNWKLAINNEMKALVDTKTWELSKLPSDRKPTGNKWVFKVKYKADGTVECYKARLIAKGFNQGEWIDFHEICSPILKLVTIRCAISLALKNKLKFILIRC